MVKKYLLSGKNDEQLDVYREKKRTVLEKLSKDAAKSAILIMVYPNVSHSLYIRLK
jgi:hypothetical protein